MTLFRTHCGDSCHSDSSSLFSVTLGDCSFSVDVRSRTFHLGENGYLFHTNESPPHTRNRPPSTAKMTPLLVFRPRSIVFPFLRGRLRCSAAFLRSSAGETQHYVEEIRSIDQSGRDFHVSSVAAGWDDESNAV